MYVRARYSDLTRNNNVHNVHTLSNSYINCVVDSNDNQIITDQRTKTTEQRPSWEADSHSDIKEIPPLFMRREGSLPFSQKPPLNLNLSYINPVHIDTHFSLKIMFNIILTSTPVSLPCRFTIKILYAFIMEQG
jgi:hypothetical protein